MLTLGLLPDQLKHLHFQDWRQETEPGPSLVLSPVAYSDLPCQEVPWQPLPKACGLLLLVAVLVSAPLEVSACYRDNSYGHKVLQPTTQLFLPASILITDGLIPTVLPSPGVHQAPTMALPHSLPLLTGPLTHSYPSLPACPHDLPQ